MLSLFCEPFPPKKKSGQSYSAVIPKTHQVSEGQSEVSWNVWPMLCPLQNFDLIRSTWEQSMLRTVLVGMGILSLGAVFGLNHEPMEVTWCVFSHRSYERRFQCQWSLFFYFWPWYPYKVSCKSIKERSILPKQNHRPSTACILLRNYDLSMIMPINKAVSVYRLQKSQLPMLG